MRKKRFSMVNVGNSPRIKAPNSREVGRQVIGVRDVRDGLADQLRAGVADDLAHLLVDAQEAALGVDVGNADGRVLERAAEPLLALAQRLLSPLPIADIARQRHRELAPRLAKRLDADFDGEDRPVLAAVPRLERDRLSGVEPPFEVLRCRMV